MSEILFLDTSAVLDGALTAPHNEDSRIYISTIVLNELEKIKNSDRREHIKYLAREAVREILNHQEYLKDSLSLARIPDYRTQKKFFKKYPFLEPDLNDHRLLLEAVLLHNQRNEMVFFVTSDATLWLFAKQIQELNGYNGIPILFEKQEENPVDYKGWNDYQPSTEQLASIYSNPSENVLGAKTNEFCKIYEGEELRDIVFWDGEKYRPLKYKEFKTVLGERIAPRNLEQKLYLDLLQNDDIPVKLCVSKFGTGKSYLALNYALHEIQAGRYDKIVFVKNNLEVKGAGVLGTLPGDEILKQAPWLRQIEDHIGIQKFEEYVESGIIEPAHLSSLRGRDLKNCIVLVDEAENLLDTNIQLLLGRIAENSIIIFCADVKQCDYDKIKKSGIPKMIERLYGHKLFGMVHLLTTERSKVAAMADLMD